MSRAEFQADRARDPIDMMIVAGSGPEPIFDAVMYDFLLQGYLGLQRRQKQAGLLEFACLGQRSPWLYRLTYRTRGLIRTPAGQVVPTERHVFALRFLPDFLHHAERFAMLRLIAPMGAAFHPNIAPSGAVCVEIYPGETPVEICQSLHDLIRWRLRQYDERDALNPIACAWGREHVDQPIDVRPLFGQRTRIQWHAPAGSTGETG